MRHGFLTVVLFVMSIGFLYGGCGAEGSLLTCSAPDNCQADGPCPLMVSWVVAGECRPDHGEYFSINFFLLNDSEEIMHSVQLYSRMDMAGFRDYLTIPDDAFVLEEDRVPEFFVEFEEIQPGETAKAYYAAKWNINESLVQFPDAIACVPGVTMRTLTIPSFHCN